MSLLINQGGNCTVHAVTQLEHKLQVNQLWNKKSYGASLNENTYND